MTKIFNRLLLLACLMAPTAATAQVCLVSKGKPQGRIVLAEDNDVNRKAAKMLQRFVRETSGAELDITATAKRAKNDVVIGGKTTEATDDGYVIDCTRGALTIKSAGGKGAIYGVSALLEKCLGVDYLAKDFYTLTPSADIRIPEMHVAESPAFRFRQTFSYSNSDSTYRDWMTTASCSPTICGCIRSTDSCRRRYMARSIRSITRLSAANDVPAITASGASPIRRFSKSWLIASTPFSRPIPDATPFPSARTTATTLTANALNVRR